MPSNACCSQCVSLEYFLAGVKCMELLIAKGAASPWQYFTANIKSEMILAQFEVPNQSSRHVPLADAQCLKLAIAVAGP